MAHEPKLTVFTLTLKPIDKTIPNTNRQLFKHLTNQTHIADNELQNSVLFMDVFRAFISKLDTPEMYKDEKNKKTMTANQPNIEDGDVEPNIIPDSGRFIIHGVVEGGNYGQKKKRTDTRNKADKSEVNTNHAITDDFYFLIYLPPGSTKSILMIQSFTDETIDSVVKRFWEDFLQFPTKFDSPRIKKYIPPAIIDDFKQNTMITKLGYSTTITSESLLDPALQIEDKNFKVTITIEPVEDMTIEEFEESKISISNKEFARKTLGRFSKKKATLKDITTGKPCSFELESDYEIKPTIFLKKYINFPNNEINYTLIKEYCLDLLENEIKPQLFPEYAIQEH